MSSTTQRDWRERAGNDVPNANAIVLGARHKVPNRGSNSGEPPTGNAGAKRLRSLNEPECGGGE